jgi:hypothetical protein
LTLASPGYRLEEPEVRASLDTIKEVFLVNKVGNGGDDSGTLPDEPLEDISAYFVGALPRLADARYEMGKRFQARCMCSPTSCRLPFKLLRFLASDQSLP